MPSPYSQSMFANLNTTIYKKGPQSTPLLMINSKLAWFVTGIKKNIHYSLIPFYGILLFALFYYMQYGSHILINRIKAYFEIINYSLKKSGNALILLDPDNRLLKFNRQAETILSTEKKIKKGSDVQEVLQNHNTLLNAVEECQRCGKVISKNISWDLPGDRFVGEVIITPFRGFLNTVTAYLIEIKDSTFHVMGERQSNWQHTISQMIHDIKNPLAALKLNLQTLNMKLSDASPDTARALEKDLQLTFTELDRIRDISRHFLKFSELQKIQVQPLDVTALCRKVLDQYAAYQNNGVIMELELAEEIPSIQADESQIEQALHVIIENALDALSGAGKIQITLQNCESLEKGRYGIEIEIADTGSGIPADIRDRIFEPSFTTKKEGNGLGLAFANQIVKQHGGEITFSSKENYGTVFSIFLPLRPDNLT